MNKNRSLHFFIILLVFTAVSAVFFNYSVFATDTNTSQDNVSVNVPVSCTMNGTGMSSHTASIPNGTYQADIGTTTLQSFCNDSQGFAIYAIGYTNEEYGNTNLIGATQNQTIVTGTATTTGNPDVSNWAVKLATSSGVTYPLTLDNSFGSYHNVPTEYTKVAHRDSGTDLGSSATGSTLTTTYAAYISKTQAADTYNGKVKYTLVHPASEVPAQPVACEAGKICYNPNTALVEGQMGKQTPSSSELTNGITLWAPNYKRTGYGFAGWNTEYDYSGTTYGPQETITAPADIETNGLSLYAVWAPSYKDMQNWLGCELLAKGEVTALRDSRDNNVYAVTKLADNKCWMIENLRLDNTPELSSANTSNPMLPLTNYNGLADKSQSNHLSQPYDPSTLAWCTTHSSDCNDQSMLATNNTTLFTNNTASNYDATGDVYGYGNYYNWYSATAGHGKYGSDYGVGYDAPGDICPKRWHLPSGNDLGNYSQLDISLGGTGISSSTSTTPTGAAMSSTYRSYPNNYVYAGYIEGSLYSRNTGGYYWTNTGGQTSVAYYLLLNSTFVDPATSYHYKYVGRTVRCYTN